MYGFNGQFVELLKYIFALLLLCDLMHDIEAIIHNSKKITTNTILRCTSVYLQTFFIIYFKDLAVGGRTGLVGKASNSRSGDPGSIFGQVGVLFP